MRSSDYFFGNFYMNMAKKQRKKLYFSLVDALCSVDSIWQLNLDVLWGLLAVTLRLAFAIFYRIFPHKQVMTIKLKPLSSLFMLDVIYDMGLRMQWCKWKLKRQIVSRSCRMNINFYRCWTMNINFYSQLVTSTFTTGRGTSILPTTSPLSSSPYPPKLFILDTYGVSSAIPVNSGDNVSVPDFGGGPEHRSSDDGMQFRTPNKGAVFFILVFSFFPSPFVDRFSYFIVLNPWGLYSSGDFMVSLMLHFSSFDLFMYWILYHLTLDWH